jgi:hypothetical protein
MYGGVDNENEFLKSIEVLYDRRNETYRGNSTGKCRA